MKRIAGLAATAFAALLAACGDDANVAQYGSNPPLPEQERGLVPTMGRMHTTDR
jgi:hypothetical protein